MPNVKELDKIAKGIADDIKSEMNKSRKADFVFPNINKSNSEDDTLGVVDVIKAALGNPEARERISKTTQTTTTGSVFVPTQVSTNLIELLAAKSVVRRAGATVIPMASSSITIPRNTAAPTTYWVGEASAVTEDTTLAFDSVTLTAKKLACLLPVSSELIADANTQVEGLIRRLIAEALAREEDKQFIYGTGAGATPTGIMNQDDVNSVDGVAAASLTFDEAYDLFSALEVDNANADGGAFIMHPSVMNLLRKLQDGNDHYLLNPNVAEGAPRTILGKPVHLSTQAYSGTSYPIIYGDFSQAYVGERAGIEIAASEHYSFNKDQIYLRALTRVDFALAQPTAFATCVVTIN